MTTTYNVIFPHEADTPITVNRRGGCPENAAYHNTPITTYRTSLPSVLRLVRLASNKPMLVPHPSGVALEIVVNSA